MTMALLLRRAVLLLDLSYRVGELVQIGADRIEESEHRGPSEVALSTLDAREVRAIEAGGNRHVGLRESGTGAQLAESLAEGL